MIACDRPLVSRWQTNRLTCASLGWYLIRRRCSRQRKLANPLIRKGRLDVKRIFAYLATIISWIRSFCHGFFRFLQSHFCSHFALSLLDKTLTPVKGWKKTNKQTNKQTGLQARFSPSLSSCQQALVAPPPKQLETRTGESPHRLVYRSSGDSRYLVIN